MEIRTTYHKELQQIQDDVLVMGSLIERGITGSIAALKNKDLTAAEQIIADGNADMVALARGMLFDPHWTWRAAATLGADVAFPPQYVRAYKSHWLRSLTARSDPSG